MHVRRDGWQESVPCVHSNSSRDLESWEARASRSRREHQLARPRSPRPPVALACQGQPDGSSAEPTVSANMHNMPRCLRRAMEKPFGLSKSFISSSHHVPMHQMRKDLSFAKLLDASSTQPPKDLQAPLFNLWRRLPSQGSFVSTLEASPAFVSQRHS